MKVLSAFLHLTRFHLHVKNKRKSTRHRSWRREKKEVADNIFHSLHVRPGESSDDHNITFKSESKTKMKIIMLHSHKNDICSNFYSYERDNLSEELFYLHKVNKMQRKIRSMIFFFAHFFCETQCERSVEVYRERNLDSPSVTDRLTF